LSGIIICIARPATVVVYSQYHSAAFFVIVSAGGQEQQRLNCTLGPFMKALSMSGTAGGLDGLGVERGGGFRRDITQPFGMKCRHIVDR
jgi:hypothetical protein